MSNSLTSSTSPLPLPEKWVEKLFDKMLLDYGKKFTDQWAGADPDKLIAHWSMQLAGYTGPELKRGYQALEALDWPPSLPQFKRLCRPTLDDSKAYYEALAGVEARERGENGAWSHPAIFWAATSMAFDLRNQTYSQIKGRWEKALAHEMEKGEWPAIPEAMPALPEPGKSVLSRDQAAKLIDELNAGGTIKQAETKTDHKAWAKRIVERSKQKSHGMSALQIRLAKEALAAKAH